MAQHPDPQRSPAAGGLSRRRPFAVTFLVLAATIVVSDLWTKAYTFHLQPPGDPHQQSLPMIEGFLAVRTVWNTGIPWGIFSGNSRILAVVSVAAILVILWVFYRKTDSGNPAFCLGLSLILGGATGNLYDRALLPGVRDWIELVPPLPLIGKWPIFNIADSAICTGAVLVYLAMTFSREAAPAAGGKAGDPPAP